MSINRPEKNTSWNEHASWYENYLQGENTYQEKIILPNIIRLMKPEKSDRILDMACGSGYFSRHFRAQGAEVVGADISPELILKARKSDSHSKYVVASADNLSEFPNASFNKIACILSIQNIENVRGVFKECRRVLDGGGDLFLVINHPCFRIPGQSGWRFDDISGKQSRLVEKYMSEFSYDIKMHPGQNFSTTKTFHRPLQFYIKTLASAGFVVSKIEEWISHRVSQNGPRKKMEDTARKEIPMFIFIGAVVRP